MRFVVVCCCYCLLVVVGIEQIAADKCKKTLRTVFFERCRVRNRRSDGFSSDMETTHHHAAKRQIMSIREIFVSSRVPIYHHVPYPSYARHEYVPVVPPSVADVYRSQRPRPESLPVESHSEIGFEMSFEEMIELVDEIYERMPRGTTKSREEMQKEFLPLFEECCKNIEVCRTKKDVTQCPYI